MRTFFVLDANMCKIEILHALNIQWNRSHYSAGSFSVQLKADSFNKDTWVYIYKDGGTELGIIQKYQYTEDAETGKTVQISGNFMEALLYNIPVMPFDYIRQIDEVSGIILYYTGEGGTPLPQPSGYSKTLQAGNIFTIFAGFPDYPATVVRACYSISQIAFKEATKYIEKLGIDDYIYPFTNISQHPISDDTLTRALDSAYYKNAEDTSDSPDTGSTTLDDQGRTIYSVSKGDTQYLGDVLDTWLNSTWMAPGYYTFTDDSASVSQFDIPPHRVPYRCKFDPQALTITLIFSAKTHVNTYEFSTDANNIIDMDYSQDISSEPAGGIARAIYLTAATEDTKNSWDRYKAVERTSLRNRYASFSELPLNPLKSGKINVECDYLGNTYEDLIAKNNCIDACEEMISNFDNASTTVSYTLTPYVPMNVEYKTLYDLGDFVKVNGVWRQIVAINEVVKDGAESISITLDAEVNSAFKNYYNSTTNPFAPGRTR